MPKGVPGTCFYCNHPSKQNIVWLKDRDGNPSRQVVPFCGDSGHIRFIAGFWPPFTGLREGVDYRFEVADPEYPIVKGDGEHVFFSFKNNVDGSVSIFTLPKIVARKFADRVREASHVPEPGCTDSTDHFRGHCGCK